MTALEKASEKWVFETNGHKWSNNDDTAGDNFGSFIAGAKWQQEQDNDFLVWDKLFAKLAWKFKPTKSGDMFIDAEAVYEELKNEFNLTFKQD